MNSRIVMTALLLGLMPMLSQAAETPKTQVIAAEIAFSQAMEDRNFEAFSSFIAKEAIFYEGEVAIRGKDAVLEFWQTRFLSKDAPFTWRPEKVEVVDSGNLAISSGPVFDHQGICFSEYTSIWQKTASNQWQVIFDKGNSKHCSYTTK